MYAARRLSSERVEAPLIAHRGRIVAERSERLLAALEAEIGKRSKLEHEPSPPPLLCFWRRRASAPY